MPVVIPPPGERAWEAFWALTRTRNGNGWAPNRITFLDIAAYRQMGRVDLAEWEVDALLAMDVAWMGRKQPTAPSEPENARVSARKLTPALFDAIT